MSKQPVFRGTPKVPLWIDFENGDHLPAWATDPCTCCPDETAWNPPPLFQFCGCMIGGVQLTISGLQSRSFWTGGCGTELTEFAGPPDMECINYSIYANGKRGDIRSYVECKDGALNGTYQTTDITGNNTSFSATIHLGEHQNASGLNRGVEICYELWEDYFGCSQPNGPPDKLWDEMEKWSYVYQINVTGSCTPCIGGSYITYDWIALTQTWNRRRVYFPAGAVCDEQGWGLPDRCRDPGCGGCCGRCNGAGKHGSGSGTCISSPACPRTASGSYAATSCDQATTVNHNIELH